jgi:exodeoxyribonuclease VII large subunit
LTLNANKSIIIPMTQLPLFQAPSWSVTDLTRYLRQILENDRQLQDIWVLGEVSNFSRPSSGHIYFTLKDETSSLRCVMWRPSVVRQAFIPRDGDAVEVHGSLGIYEVSGTYQLYADLIRPTGEGILYQEFLRLKARLEAEGLFDPARKRPIPRWPQRIGIVSSPTGAALRDMLNTIRRRYPLVEVTLAPTPVQGDEAPGGIVAALKALNRLVEPDVILLARGGGSIEDLWAFNDEGVARAIVASRAPVISGVGHETDFTIADFAADLRAPTPTAAAELATPHQADLIQAIRDLLQRLERGAAARLALPRWKLNELDRRLLMVSPAAQLRTDRQRLDELLHGSHVAVLHSLRLQRERLLGLKQRLEGLSPQAVLRRGYSIVQHPDGRLVQRIAQVSPGDPLKVRVSDGDFGVRVESRQEP